MRNRGCVIGCSGAFGLFVGLLLLSTLAIKIMWEWTVADVFPGAVSQGLVAESISWWAAFKLALVVAVLGAIVGAYRNHGPGDRGP